MVSGAHFTPMSVSQSIISGPWYTKMSSSSSGTPSVPQAFRNALNWSLVAS